MIKLRIMVLSISIVLLTPLTAIAETYSFIVQPFQSSVDTKRVYLPLAKYLSSMTGHKIELKTSPNFLAYWQSMKKGQYDLILDAAHLTDYRAEKMEYTVLAKVLDVVSLSTYWRGCPCEGKWEAAWDQAALAPPGSGASFLSLSLSLSQFVDC